MDVNKKFKEYSPSPQKMFFNGAIAILVSIFIAIIYGFIAFDTSGLRDQDVNSYILFHGVYIGLGISLLPILIIALTFVVQLTKAKNKAVREFIDGKNEN